MFRITMEVKVFKEEDVYVALCPELNVSSFLGGDDIESAKKSLREALEAFVEECEAMGTLEDVLEEAGFVKAAQNVCLFQIDATYAVILFNSIFPCSNSFMTPSILHISS